MGFIFQVVQTTSLFVAIFKLVMVSRVSMVNWVLPACQVNLGPTVILATLTRTCDREGWGESASVETMAETEAQAATIMRIYQLLVTMDCRLVVEVGAGGTEQVMIVLAVILSTLVRQVVELIPGSRASQVLPEALVQQELLVLHQW